MNESQKGKKIVPSRGSHGEIAIQSLPVLDDNFWSVYLLSILLLYLCDKIHKNNLKRGKISFGSQLQVFQRMLDTPVAVACVEAETHGGKWA